MSEEKSDDYYQGVAFLSIQSGTPDQPTDRLTDFVNLFCKTMHEEKIRPYVTIQIGKPGGGGCPPGGCH